MISLAIMMLTGAGLVNVSVLFSELLNKSLGIHFFDILLILIGIGFIFTFLLLPILSASVMHSIENKKRGNSS
jgi:nitrogen fixation/metabolism regulation signal transduction histidine kinase